MVDSGPVFNIRKRSQKSGMRTDVYLGLVDFAWWGGFSCLLVYDFTPLLVEKGFVKELSFLLSNLVLL